MATSFFDPKYLDDVYEALFQKLKAATFEGGVTLKQSQRVMIAPDEVAVASQPAMFLTPGPIHAEEKEFALGKWTFTAIVLIYLRGGSAIPAMIPTPQTIGFYIVWGLVAALYAGAEPPYSKQTLDGLVYHCWIEGDVTVSTADEQVVVAIPVYILAGDVG